MDALAPSVNLSAQMSSVPALAEQLRNGNFLHLKVHEFLWFYFVLGTHILCIEHLEYL